MILRPRFQMLLQDAQAGQIDVVLAEALDRLGRNISTASSRRSAKNDSRNGSGMRAWTECYAAIRYRTCFSSNLIAAAEEQ